MLHNRLLNYLDEVVRCGSIRAASRKLNIASSAINRQILALEADLGTPIFDRLPRRLRLTAVGELLIEHVRTTLRSHERLGAQIADFTIDRSKWRTFLSEWLLDHIAKTDSKLAAYVDHPETSR